MIELPLVVSMTVDHSVNEYELSVENNQNTIPINNTVVISVERTVPEYEGDYVVTASTDGAITLMTEGKKCVDNITVNKLQKQTILNPNISINANTGLATALTTYQIGYNDVTTITSKTYQMPILHPRIITPSEYEQAVATKGDYAVGTIKVAPIPSNYGKIEWNGQFLTVS